MPPESIPQRASQPSSEESPIVERYREALSKAKEESGYESHFYESGIAHPSFISEERVSAFPEEVQVKLQNLANEIAAFLRLDAFSDKYNTKHDERRAWRNKLNPNVKHFFKGTRLSGNKIQKVVSAANQVMYPLNRAIKDGRIQEQNSDVQEIVTRIKAIQVLANPNFGRNYNTAEADDKFKMVKGFGEVALDYLRYVTDR